MTENCEHENVIFAVTNLKETDFGHKCDINVFCEKCSQRWNTPKEYLTEIRQSERNATLDQVIAEIDKTWYHPTENLKSVLKELKK